MLNAQKQFNGYLKYIYAFKFEGRKPVMHCGPQARAWTWTYSGEINFHKLLVGEHKLLAGEQEPSSW